MALIIYCLKARISRRLFTTRFGNGTIHGTAVPDAVLRRLRPAPVRRGWLGLWLTVERFPLFRWPWLPWWLGRLLVAPAIVDGFWHGMASGLSFAALRVGDVWQRSMAARGG